VECDEADVKQIRKIMKGIGKVAIKKGFLNGGYIYERTFPDGRYVRKIYGQKVYYLRTDLSLNAVKKLWYDTNRDLHYAYQSLNWVSDFDGTRDWQDRRINEEDEQTGDICGCIDSECKHCIHCNPLHWWLVRRNPPLPHKAKATIAELKRYDDKRCNAFINGKNSGLIDDDYNLIV